MAMRIIQRAAKRSSQESLRVTVVEVGENRPERDMERREFVERRIHPAEVVEDRAQEAIDMRPLESESQGEEKEAMRRR